MNKAEKLLREAISYFPQTSYFKMKVQEYLDRGEKIRVGSEWICDIGFVATIERECYEEYYEGEEVTITKINERGHLTLNNQSPDDINVLDFLDHFVPKEDFPLDEIEKFFSRRDKLERGSEWICVVACTGYYVPHVNGQKVIVNSFTTSKVKQQIVEVTTTDQGKDEIPLEQFLTCFIPKDFVEKGE